MNRSLCKNYGLFFSLLMLCGTYILSSTAAADDRIDAVDFVDEASAKGVAEIESAKLALEKSKSADVQTFARKMIEDHTAANKELATIAKRKNLKVADEAQLMAKAKQFILTLRDGESFDAAYANNQVRAHEQTVELFQRATRSADAEIKAFATKVLPKLEHHLLQARQLVQVTERVERTDDKYRSASSHSSASSRSSASSVQGTDRGVGTVPNTTYSN